MANKISLTPENINYLRYAFAHFFPEDAIYSADKPYISGEFNWKDRRDFIDFVYRLTGISIKSEKDFANIKKAELAVEELASESTGGEKPTESNMPDKVAREQQEAERLKREIGLKETQKSAQKNVEEAFRKKQEIYKRQQEIERTKKSFEEKIQKQKEIQSFLEDKKIYVKVETPQAQTPDENTKQFIEKAKTYPQSFRKEISNIVKVKIHSSEFAKNMSEEEIAVLADKTANDTVFAINNPSQQIETTFQTAILRSVSKETNIVKGISSDTNVQNSLKTATRELTFFNNSTQLSRNILASVNGGLAAAVFGPDPDEIKVTLTTQPVEGYTHEINLHRLSDGYSNLLQSQSNFLDNVTSFGKDQAQSFLLGQARNFIDSQIVKLPADSLITGIYNSEIGQQALSVVGLTKYTPFGGGIFISIIQQIPGASTFFEGLGSSLGINFGFTFITPAATEVASTAIVATEGVSAIAGAAALETGVVTAGVGGVIAGEAIGTGVGAAAGGATGTAVGAAGGATTGAGTGAAIGLAGGPLAIVTAAIGAAVGWIASKIPWDKIKKNAPYIMGTVLGIGSFAIAGPVVGIVAGVGSYGLASAAAGGTINLGTVGSSIGRFFTTLGGVVLVSIGTPVLVTLLVFPVVVALILFIINSGAYVVPPTQITTLSSNPYIQVDKAASPQGPFKNTELPLQISYTITVTAKKSLLTNIAFKNDCQIFSTGPAKTCPSEVPTNIPDSISPSIPYVFTYTENYSGNDYKDSVILDTFTVIADSEEAAQQEVSGAASISIGTPPAACLNIDSKAWPSEYYANIVNARGVMVSKYGSYISKVCMSYPSLPLRYNPISFESFWGWNHGSYVDFYKLGVKNQADALYTLSHELGHSLSWGNKTAKLYQLYLEYPGITSESPYCFYGATKNWNDGESLPEAIALYVIQPRCGNVQQKWPIHYQFLMRYVFN